MEFRVSPHEIPIVISTREFPLNYKKVARLYMVETVFDLLTELESEKLSELQTRDVQAIMSKSDEIQNEKSQERRRFVLELLAKYDRHPLLLHELSMLAELEEETDIFLEFWSKRGLVQDQDIVVDMLKNIIEYYFDIGELKTRNKWCQELSDLGRSGKLDANQLSEIEIFLRSMANENH